MEEQKEEYFHKQAREIAFANKRWQNNFPLSAADDTIPLRYYVSINDAIAGALWVTRNGRNFGGRTCAGDGDLCRSRNTGGSPTGSVH